MISLISVEDYENLGPFFGPYGWENENLKFAPGYWIPSAIMKNALDSGYRIEPITEVQNLSTFFGDAQLDQFAYGESLTCLCISRYDGLSIRGISILHPAWHETICFDLKLCFRYHEPNDEEHYWRLIRHRRDIDWLSGYWDEKSGFREWIKTI